MTSIIELGTDWNSALDEPSYRPRRAPGRWSAVAILAALLFAPAGERPADLSGLVRYTEVAVANNADFHVIEDAVLVTDPTGITTYGLDGALRGRAAVPQLRGWTSVAAHAGLIWVRNNGEQGSRTIVLGPDGDLRWTAPGTYFIAKGAGFAVGQAGPRLRQRRPS